METDPPKTLVIRPSNRSGFFCNFNHVIRGLQHGLGTQNIQAVRVDWVHRPDYQHFPYFLQEGENIWDRFFYPLEFDSFPEQEIEINDIEGGYYLSGRKSYVQLYGRRQAWRRQYHAIYSRYVKLQPWVEAEVDAFVDRHFTGKTCLGVHYRDPRHREGPLPRPSIAYFISRLRKLAPARGDWCVFLATDVQEAVPAFRAALGDRLVVADVHRQSQHSDEQMHHRVDNGGKDLGKEVLMDCLLLARCHTLLYNTSHLATAVGYINPELHMVYCERARMLGLFTWWFKRTFRPVAKRVFPAYLKTTP